MDCVFVREVWTRLCEAMNKPEWAPTRGTDLGDWCTTKEDTARGKKNVRAIFLLVMWELWKHRNAIEFEAARPSVRHVLSRIVVKGKTWKSAGILKGEVETFLGILATWADARS